MHYQEKAQGEWSYVCGWYKPKCITFIPLYLVFCYLLCVNWVNNIIFHDLGVKYGQRTKIVQKRAKTTLRAKWSFHTKNERSHFLNPWWILSLKNQTLKFLWFRDSFEGVLDENMQEGGFWINLKEVNFWQFWPPRGILGITKNSCIFWRRLFLGKL